MKNIIWKNLLKCFTLKQTNKQTSLLCNYLKSLHVCQLEEGLGKRKINERKRERERDGSLEEIQKQIPGRCCNA